MDGMAGKRTSTPGRRGRHARRICTVGACLAAMLLLGGAAAPAPDRGPAPQQIMNELRQANTARAQLLREEQEWAMESERLELLLATLGDETKRLTGEAAEADTARAGFRQQLAGLRAQQERFEQVEAAIDTLCERLEEALDALAARSLPGLVPPDRAAGITEPDKRLAAAVGRLDETARRGLKAAVEIVQGDLEGKTLTIKLLRLGGVAAWWVAFDGGQAGTAAMAGGTLALKPAASPEDTEAITKAFAIVEGRAAPHWVLLPLAGTTVKRGDGAGP